MRLLLLCWHLCYNESMILYFSVHFLPVATWILTHKGVGPPAHWMESISLRLLALILCSNCSNTFNKVLTTTCRHTVKLLFETSGHHFSLLNMFHGWSKHFTSRYDPSTPNALLPHPTITTMVRLPSLCPPGISLMHRIPPWGCTFKYLNISFA